MVDVTNSKVSVSPLSTAQQAAKECYGNTKADENGPMSEKSKADGKGKDLKGSVAEEQE